MRSIENQKPSVTPRSHQVDRKPETKRDTAKPPLTRRCSARWAASSSRTTSWCPGRGSTCRRCTCGRSCWYTGGFHAAGLLAPAAGVIPRVPGSLATVGLVEAMPS